MSSALTAPTKMALRNKSESAMHIENKATILSCRQCRAYGLANHEPIEIADINGLEAH